MSQSKFIDCYGPVDNPFLEALLKADVDGVCRYLGAKSRGYSKGMTPSEVSLLKSKGCVLSSTFPWFYHRFFLGVIIVFSLVWSTRIPWFNHEKSLANFQPI